MTDNKLILPLDNTERDVLSRRTEEERERDKVLIARMYVRGKSQHEMAKELATFYPDVRINAKIINTDLQSIRQAWLQSTLVDFNAAKSKELARLDETEREAWDAWERSKEKRVRREYEINDDQVAFSADRIADVKRKKKKLITEETVGDIKYLEMIERMITLRCNILGLLEAQRIQVDWRTEALQTGMDERTIDAVKEKTIATLLEAISQAAKESGAIKEADIIDVEAVDAE